MIKPLARWKFNGGEISPAINFHIDLDKHPSSCLKVENRFVLQTGGLRRRPGTTPIKKLTNESDHLRVIPFEFSNDVIYAIVFLEVAGVVRLQVISPDGTIEADIATTYNASKLKEIQHVQSLDVIIFTQADVPPMRLERQPNKWDFVRHELRGGPYQDVDDIDKHFVKIWAKPWIDGRAYDEGDYVVYGKIENVDTSLNTDLLVCDSANPTSLSTIGQRELLISDNGTTRIFKRFKTIEFFLGGAGPGVAGNHIDKLSINDAIYFADTASMGVDPYVVAAKGNGDTRVYLHSEFYEEISETANVETVLSDNLGDFSPVNIAQPSDIYRAVKIDMDSRIRKCIQDVGNGSGILVTNASYWEVAESYIGELFVFSTDGYEVFPDEVLGYRWRFFGKGKQSFSGRFRYNTGDGSIDYRDGLTQTIIANRDYSKSFPGVGEIEFKTEKGTWNGVALLEGSTDNGVTWFTIAVISSDGSQNSIVTEEIFRTGTILRVRMEAMNNVDPGDDDNFENENQCRFIVTVNSSVYSQATIEENYLTGGIFARVSSLDGIIDTSETHEHSLETFNPLNGFPNAVTYFEQRLWFGGSKSFPLTVWGSYLNDDNEWNDAFISAASALTFEIYATRFNPIRSLMSRDSLIALTQAGLFVIASRSSDTGLTAETPPQITHESNEGSESIQGVSLSNAGFYAELYGKRIRSIRYQFEYDQQESTDVTIFADHITGHGITELSAVQSPQNMLFALRNDGEVAALTFEPNQNVFAWCRFIIGDGVRSFAGTSGQSSDILWVVVQRGDDAWLEQLDFSSPADLDWRVEASNLVLNDTFEIPADAPADLEIWHNDARLVLDRDYSIAGTTVTIISDITLDSIVLGIPFEDLFETTNISVGGMLFGGTNQIIGMDVYHSTSFPFEVSYDGGEAWNAVPWSKANFTEQAIIPAISFANISGIRKTAVNVSSIPSDETTISIKSSFPKDNDVHGIGIYSQKIERS